MNLESQVETTQAGIFTVSFLYKHARADVQDAAFGLKRLKKPTLAEIGFLQGKEEGDKKTFERYSRLDNDVLYDDRKGGVPVVLPYGTISNLVGIANLVESHGQNREYVIPKNFREMIYAVVDQMIKDGTAVVANNGEMPIGTAKFGETPLTSILYSNIEGFGAKERGEWLSSQGKQFQTFYFDSKDYAKAQKGPYLNKLRVSSPDDGFGVDGDNWYLDYDYGAFGVRFEKTAEGGAQR